MKVSILKSARSPEANNKETMTLDKNEQVATYAWDDHEPLDVMCENWKIVSKVCTTNETGHWQ